MATVRRRQVVVITGASSGIGRATAHEFAKYDATLILVARDREKLEKVAREIGGACFARPADVTDARALSAIAEEAVQRFGRLDVWINNAGVIVTGEFLEIAVEKHRQVIETNLIGYVNGAHAALTVFVRQGFGTLIQNASVAARLVPPHMSSYVAAKFGVRGLTHALRQDLALRSLDDVHVCEINPGLVDTPALAHSDQPFTLPKTSVERVAERIVYLSAHPRREMFVGFGARLGSWAYSVSPAITAGALRLLTKLNSWTHASAKLLPRGP